MKKPFLSYLWDNSKYFYLWLPFPVLFILYWITFQDNYIGDVVFTCILVCCAWAAITITLFVKWKNL